MYILLELWGFFFFRLIDRLDVQSVASEPVDRLRNNRTEFHSLVRSFTDIVNTPFHFGLHNCIYLYIYITYGFLSQTKEKNLCFLSLCVISWRQEKLLQLQDCSNIKELWDQTGMTHGCYKDSSAKKNIRSNWVDQGDFWYC